MLRLLLALILICSFAHASASLEQKMQKELQLLNLPAAPWRPVDDDMCDVAIIGAGQAGLSIAYALELEGVYNVKVFDAAESGKEGPWRTTARMPSLRSGKALRGPAQLPHLTFRAWYESQHGKKSWNALGKIPTVLWGEYLQWLAKSSGVAVCNCWRLQEIVPNQDNSLTLLFDGERSVRCRKVVLATGRTGFGGPQIPDFISEIPKKYWAHTSDAIEPSSFANKKVAVIGVGASGFDAAATALENGAKGVQMIMRRSSVPQINYAAPFGYPGFMYGFYYLSDKERADYFAKLHEMGTPPTQESTERLAPFSSFELVSSCAIQSCFVRDNKVALVTSKGTLLADFIVLATGYCVNVERQRELAALNDKIVLWNDRLPDVLPKLGKFPYLGPHFEFMEKHVGEAPYLANIHCFNYGGFLSHGRICGDIDAMHIGVRRLVEGICIGLFLQDTCRNGEPVPNECPGTCQSGLCSPFVAVGDG